jgi:uncharacterized protein (DUF433 family)
MTKQQIESQFPLLAVDEHTCWGAPRIAGTRVSVWCLLANIAEIGVEKTRAGWPWLTDDQVCQAIGLAAEVLKNLTIESQDESLKRGG